MTDQDQLVTLHFIVEAALPRPKQWNLIGQFFSLNIMEIFLSMECYRTLWKRVLFSKHAQVFMVEISHSFWSIQISQFCPLKMFCDAFVSSYTLYMIWYYTGNTATTLLVYLVRECFPIHCFVLNGISSPGVLFTKHFFSS